MTFLTTSNRHKHLIISFLIALFSWGMAMGAGIAAEYKDKVHGGKFDWIDLLADIIGIGLALLVRFF